MEYAVEDYDMPKGVFVKSVAEGSAAEKAGIMKGDIITRLDNEKVTEMVQLQNILEYYTAGEAADVVIERFDSGEYYEETLSVTLGQRE